MGLVTPGIGLIVWMTIAFLVVWVGLGKFAWPAILDTIKQREETIENALNAAETARKEMAELNSENEQILKTAREERDAILKEGQELRDKIINEAKEKAQIESTRIVAKAKENIESEKAAAIAEIKNHVATLSIEIAEKILKNELSDNTKQNQLVTTLLTDIKLN